MARRAVDLLVDLIDGGAPHSVIVKTAPTLMRRESTAKPPKAKRRPA
jgi:DNA-binding LacI/PurR family transcriptional regulator